MKPGSRGLHYAAASALLGAGPWAYFALQADRLGSLPAAAQQVPLSPQQGQAYALLAESLEQEGIELNWQEGYVAIEARVRQRFQALEYLLVGAGGQNHETLFQTAVTPSVLNTALLALGLSPGQNATWIEIPGKTAPIGSNLNDGSSATGGAAPGAESQTGTPAKTRTVYRIEPPLGEGCYLYAGWKQDGEVYFFRVEDLLANVELGRSMRRHRFVYLGSRLITLKPGSPEVFAADVEQNLINISFFSAGHTLFSAAVPEAESEENWYANNWLLPQEDQPVRLIFARELLTVSGAAQPQQAFEQRLPSVRFGSLEPSPDPIPTSESSSSPR